jgi:hypothetical protein
VDDEGWDVGLDGTDGVFTEGLGTSQSVADDVLDGARSVGGDLQ